MYGCQNNCYCGGLRRKEHIAHRYDSKYIFKSIIIENYLNTEKKNL